MAYKFPFLGQQQPIPQMGVPAGGGMGMGQGVDQGMGQGITIGERLPAPTPKPMPPRPTPTPWPSTPGTEPGSRAATPSPYGPRPKTTVPALEITPAFESIYQSMKNIDPEQRADYLKSTSENIKARLDRYEFRLARGLPLTPDQQTQYNSLKASFNDIQRYINNPQQFEDYFAKQEQNQAEGADWRSRMTPATVRGRPAF